MQAPHKTLTLLSAIGLCTFACGSADAATITWGPATAVSTGIGNSSDVSTNGSLVEAYNAVQLSSTSGSVTVNGVTFTNTTNLLGNVAGAQDFSSGTNGGDASYDALLSSLDFGGGVNPTITLGDGDGNTSVSSAGLLTAGDEYEIQVWFVEDRQGLDGRVMQYSSGGGDPVVALNDQFAIGSFTADGTTQDLTLQTVGFGNAHITAYQIRAVPEPASAIVGLIGLGALTLRRRRSS